MALRWRALAVLLAVAVMVVHGQELLDSASQQEPATSSEQLDAVNKELMAHLDDQVLEDLKSWNQDLLSQVDLEEVTKDQFGTLARNNPLGFLSLLQVMPKEGQLEFLKAFGARVQEETGQTCNVYGGTESCMTLPSNSSFARLCPAHDLKVDCAYYTEDLHEIQYNPVKDMKAAVEQASGQDVEATCPECFDNARKWYCHNIVPKCGSFSSQVETAILPAAQDIVAAQDAGDSPLAALATAVPRLLRAMSLALPCKEMCVALMDSCSCGQPKTLGQLLDSYSASATGEALPQGFSKQLFGPVYNKSLCDLYASSSEEGFAGHCEVLADQCSDEQGWCGASGNPVPGISQELMASQLADSVFGFLQTWAPTAQEDMAHVADEPDIQTLENKYIREGVVLPSQGKSSSPWIWAVGGALTALAVAASIAGGLWYLKVRQSRRPDPDAHYVAMTEAESLLNPPVADL